MHPAFVFLICFLLVSIVGILVCFCSWKHELSPALDAVLFWMFGINPHDSGIEEAAVSALQTASGAAVPVHFSSDRSDVQLGGQMVQAGGQIDQPEGQVGQAMGQISQESQDINPWPVLHSLHSQEGQIPGQTMEEAQKTK